MTLASLSNIVTFAEQHVNLLYAENVMERAYFACVMDRTKSNVLNEFVRFVVELSTRAVNEEQSEEALLLVMKLMADGAASASLALQFLLRRSNNQRRLFCAGEGVQMLSRRLCVLFHHVPFNF